MDKAAQTSSARVVFSPSLLAGLLPSPLHSPNECVRVRPRFLRSSVARLALREAEVPLLGLAHIEHSSVTLNFDPTTLQSEVFASISIALLWRERLIVFSRSSAGCVRTRAWRVVCGRVLDSLFLAASAFQTAGRSASASGVGLIVSQPLLLSCVPIVCPAPPPSSSSFSCSPSSSPIREGGASASGCHSPLLLLDATLLASSTPAASCECCLYDFEPKHRCMSCAPCLAHLGFPRLTAAAVAVAADCISLPSPIREST